MKDFSVLLPFHLNLEVEALHSTEQKRLMEAVALYLLGVTTYSKANAVCGSVGVKKEFANTLKLMPRRYIKNYRSSFRKGVLGERKLHTFDEYWIRKLSIPLDKVHVTKYPSEETVCKNMMPSIKNKVNFRNQSTPLLKNGGSIGFEDVCQSMIEKVLLTYRLYIPSVNTVLDVPAFYQCLHNSVTNGFVDFIRGLTSQKAGSQTNIVSIYNTLEDDECPMIDGAEEPSDVLFGWRSDYAPNPEEVLMAKQMVNRRMPRREAATLELI